MLRLFRRLRFWENEAEQAEACGEGYEMSGGELVARLRELGMPLFKEEEKLCEKPEMKSSASASGS